VRLQSSSPALGNPLIKPGDNGDFGETVDFDPAPFVVGVGSSDFPFVCPLVTPLPLAAGPSCRSVN